MITLEDSKYITDSKGKRVGVLIDIATYEKFLEALEELEDIKAYDEVKNKVKMEIRIGRSSTLQEYLNKRMKRAR
jgi:hypothetical protein